MVSCSTKALVLLARAPEIDCTTMQRTMSCAAVYLSSPYPLRSSSTPLSCPSSALLSPGFGSPAIRIDHLFHIFHMIIVHHIVLLLPHHILVDQVHPCVNRPYFRMKGHN